MAVRKFQVDQAHQLHPQSVTSLTARSSGRLRPFVGLQRSLLFRREVSCSAGERGRFGTSHLGHPKPQPPRQAPRPPCIGQSGARPRPGRGGRSGLTRAGLASEVYPLRDRRQTRGVEQVVQGLPEHCLDLAREAASGDHVERRIHLAAITMGRQGLHRGVAPLGRTEQVTSLLQERTRERVKLELVAPIDEYPDIQSGRAHVVGFPDAKEHCGEFAVEHRSDRQRRETALNFLAERGEHLLGKELVERVRDLGAAFGSRLSRRWRAR